jgi:hypothetical protein
VSVVGNESGGHLGQSRRYQISLEKLATGDTGDTGDKLSRVTNDAQTGDMGVTPGVTNATERGVTGVTLPAPQQNPNRSSASGHSFRSNRRGKNARRYGASKSSIA